MKTTQNSTTQSDGSRIGENISLYDKYNYDYSTYWTTRSYEHDAEVYALRRILKNITGKWFIDIGGSYGRHIPQYKDKFSHSVLLDYSLKGLRQAQEALTSQGITTVFPVAANAYHLPFKDSTFDAGMMIRVIHHLENPGSVLDEIVRTCSDQSTFVLEFPNKLHVKSLAKAIIHGNVSYLRSSEPARVVTIQPEGSRETDPGIMLNFAPRYIKQLLSERNMHIHSSSAISFLRLALLKRLFPESVLIHSEHVLQTIFKRSTLTPSIILRTSISKRSHARSSTPQKTNTSSLDHILVCPSCHGELDHHAHSYSCTTCSLSFPISYGIPDLRFPLVTE